MVHEELTYKLIGLSMQVHTTLGYGFLEKVYENALMVLLRNNSVQAEQQAPIPVLFEGEKVGDYYADILVENKIVLELKAADSIAGYHRAQLLNYLKATGFKVGIILNFDGRKLEHERLVL
ncbi:MAG TPA: GxxExxY protein [Sulfuricella sp.]|nr:GxxExxY protein [Sulfuricella sp.]